MTKICTKCGVAKDADIDFYTNTRGSKMAECKKCNINRALNTKRRLRATPQGRLKATIANSIQNSNRKSPTRIYAYLKAIAKVRECTFNLSVQECVELSGNPCEYCGGTLPDYGIGLDRIDNLRGYESGNVLPCCSICNIARGAFFTVDEMRRFIGPAIRAAREWRESCASL